MEQRIEEFRETIDEFEELLNVVNQHIADKSSAIFDLGKNITDVCKKLHSIAFKRFEAKSSSLAAEIDAEDKPISALYKELAKKTSPDGTSKKDGAPVVKKSTKKSTVKKSASRDSAKKKSKISDLTKELWVCIDKWKGKEPNEVDSKKRKEYLDKVRELLKQGADQNETDAQQNTGLFYAKIMPWRTMVEAFQKYMPTTPSDADESSSEDEPEPDLIAVAAAAAVTEATQKKTLVKNLLSAERRGEPYEFNAVHFWNRDLSSSSSSSTSPIHSFSLQYTGFQKDQTNIDDALFVCIYDWSKDKKTDDETLLRMNELLSKGAHPDAFEFYPSIKTRITGLYYACENNNVDMTRMLLRFGATLQYKMKNEKRVPYNTTHFSVEDKIAFAKGKFDAFFDAIYVSSLVPRVTYDDCLNYRNFMPLKRRDHMFNPGVSRMYKKTIALFVKRVIDVYSRKDPSDAKDTEYIRLRAELTSIINSTVFINKAVHKDLPLIYAAIMSVNVDLFRLLIPFVPADDPKYVFEVSENKFRTPRQVYAKLKQKQQDQLGKW